MVSLELIIHKRASFTRECDHIWLTLLRTVKESAEYEAWITYGTQRAKLAYKTITLYLNSDSNTRMRVN